LVNSYSNAFQIEQLLLLVELDHALR
jgi:hypothetical protein